MNKKVLFVVGSSWASGYYRMTQAANLLAQSGFHAEVIYFSSIAPMDLTGSRYALNRTDGLEIVDLTKFDTVVFQIVTFPELLYVIHSLKAKGIKTSMEIDDDYFALPASNPSFLSFHPRVKTIYRGGKFKSRISNTKINFKLDTLRKACKEVDTIQVSTPELKEVYSSLSNNVVVLENCVENLLYDVTEKRKNKAPVLGWFGTRTHQEDLKLILGSFPKSTSLLIAGYPEARNLIFKDYPNVEVIPPYDVSKVPEIVAKCDVGIVPLTECRFNDGKSDLKGVEFGAGCVPVIASDGAPYRRWIRHGENGFLVKHNKFKLWQRYIKQLLEDSKLRSKLGVEAKKDAIKRDIASHIDKWITTYFI